MARRRQRPSTAFVDLMMAIATGKNPLDKSSPWGGKDVFVATRDGELKEGVKEGEVDRMTRSVKVGKDGENQYWESAPKEGDSLAARSKDGGILVPIGERYSATTSTLND